MSTQIIHNDIILKRGSNAIENTELVTHANPDHWWVHMSLLPSPHVIILSDNINDDILSVAGNFCLNGLAKHKQQKIKTVFPICYCRIRNIITTDVPGEIEFKSNHRKKLFHATIYKNEIL